MAPLTVTSAHHLAARSPIPFHAFGVLAKAGFRRYSTYRQATLAGTFTNTVFGFLRCSVMLATAGSAGTVAGYHGSQLVAYVWIGQGLIATVGLWGDTMLATRIRTGEIVSDLLRPIHPIASYFATDLGRAAFAMMTRFVVPVLVGIVCFDFYTPRRLSTYPLFGLSVLLATTLSFACRYVVNATSFWLLDGRGAQMSWTIAATFLGGLYFPLSFLPPPISTALRLATPFPSLLQTPLDIATERNSVPISLGYLGVQAVWIGLAFSAAFALQRRGERRLVVNGG